MRVTIGAPNMGLSANERRVLELIREGKQPREIAKILHLPHGLPTEIIVNEYGAYCDTVINIITALRNKGYDIPKIEGGFFIMAEKIRRTPEEKQAIIAAYQGGKKFGEIAQELGIPKQTVYSIVQAWKAHGGNSLQAEKEEPAEEVVTASSMLQENINDTDDVDTSITQNNDVVKSEPVIPQAVIEACWGRVDELNKQIASEQAVIDNWKAQIADINEFLELAKMCDGGAV